MAKRHFPVRPNLEQLKHQAKDLLRAFRAGDADAVEDFRQHLPMLVDGDPRFPGPKRGGHGARNHKLFKYSRISGLDQSGSPTILRRMTPLRSMM